MTINRLLKDSKLGLKEIEILNLAFDKALRSLSLVDRNDPLADMIARKIIEIGAAGVADPAKISQMAVTVTIRTPAQPGVPNRMSAWNLLDTRLSRSCNAQRGQSPFPPWLGISDRSRFVGAA
jgi:hypothetical protein